MKIGNNIKKMKEAHNLSAEELASKIGKSLDEYLKIENDVVDITLNELEKIAEALFCTPCDLIQSSDTIGQIRNYFHNNEGNHGININVQGIDQEEIRRGYKELYGEELQRIPKLERLLRENNIYFDF
ncbi:MAG TPA: helix-turn-helix transcriptional regulator [Hanamia sp.]